MKKRKVLLPIMATLTLIAIGYQGFRSLNCAESGYSSLSIENVDALTDAEIAPPKTGWSSTHLCCYTSVVINGVRTPVATGKFQGISWANSNSQKGAHIHNCSDCNKLP